MDIKTVSEEKLIELLDLYKDRIETITEYISDTDDSDERFQLENQLYRYREALKMINSELKFRKEKENLKDENIDLDSILEKLKSSILEKLDFKVVSEKYTYIEINNARSIEQILNSIKLNSRIYHSIGLMTEDFLSIIPESVLAGKQIYLNKNDILQNNGISIYINSSSKHYKNSESYHYGNSNSEHFENSESYHLDNSNSKHWNNCRSIHFDNAKSIHYDNSEFSHFGNSTYEKPNSN